MELADLENEVTAVFGKRGAGGSQEATGALGVFAAQPVSGNTIFFYARQGGGQPENLVPYNNYIIVDARQHVITRRGKSEWTGYHAEMIIVSAMLKQLHAGRVFNFRQGEVTFKAFMKWVGAMIAANAPCCHHCHSMLLELGIQRPDPGADRSRTGWWNPLTDEVYANGSPEFSDDIPGGTVLNPEILRYVE